MARNKRKRIVLNQENEQEPPSKKPKRNSLTNISNTNNNEQQPKTPKRGRPKKTEKYNLTKARKARHGAVEMKETEFNTTKTSGLCLSRKDVKKIKEYVTYMQKKSNMTFDRRKICILFDTIKSAFGEQVFEGLLKFPLKSRESFSRDSTSDHWVHKNNNFTVSDCSLDSDGHGQGVYIGDITIHFNKAPGPDITKVFNKKQQEFLGKIGLDSSFSIFRIQRSMEPSTKNCSFGYEVLPFRKSWVQRGGGAMFMFGFSANTKAIEMVPIFMDFRQAASSSLSTKYLPASIERVWLFAKDDLMAKSNVFHLILDHEAKSKLNTIMIHSETRKRFTVNVKCNVQLSPRFTIENMSNQCQMVGYKKMKVTDNEDVWRMMMKQMQQEAEEDSDEYY